jgi:NMT1/THI5 like
LWTESRQNAEDATSHIHHVAAALLLTGQIAYSAQTSELKPEKNPLEVAIAATGPLYLPVLLANEAGYFSKRGLTVNISTLSATASAQALLSGQVDIYQGGTATIHANVGGADLIYIAASVDRSTLMLFGQKGSDVVWKSPRQKRVRQFVWFVTAKQWQKSFLLKPRRIFRHGSDPVWGWSGPMHPSARWFWRKGGSHVERFLRFFRPR